MCARILLAALLLGPALGQSSHRALSGCVTDSRGQPLNGAVVQIKNTRSLAIRSYITRRQGRYFFYGLNPDVDYRIVARYGRVLSRAKTLSSFDSRRQAVIDLKVPTRE